MTITEQKLIEYFKLKIKEHIEYNDVQKILLIESYQELFGVKMNINCENQLIFAYLELYKYINTKYEI